MKWAGAKGLDGPTGWRVEVTGGGPEELEMSSRGQLWREQLLSGLASGATALLWGLEREDTGKIGWGHTGRTFLLLVLEGRQGGWGCGSTSPAYLLGSVVLVTHALEEKSLAACYMPGTVRGNKCDFPCMI